MENVEILEQLRAVNASAAFNRWAGFEVTEAEPGRVRLRLEWREDLGQYSGHLHAALVAGLVDTACGFAAFTQVGVVAASHCAVNFVSPGVGTAFVATARSVKAGRKQVFVTAEVHAEREGESVLVAFGTTLLVPLAAQSQGTPGKVRE